MAREKNTTKTDEVSEEMFDTPVEKPQINCLRKEKVTVRFIPKETGLVQNPKHVLYGGMAETATRTFTCPQTQNGAFKQVLTEEEQEYLEKVMGLEIGALNPYKKTDNLWDDGNENCVANVILYKQDNILDLSDPEDYIKYKVLLANNNAIAPSIESLQVLKKATYQYVLVREEEEIDNSSEIMNKTMACYKEYGKIEDDHDSLRYMVETLLGKPIDKRTKIAFLKVKNNELIQANAKTYLATITDPYFKTKVLIKRAIDAGVIASRGMYLYLREDNSPLCEAGEDPTMQMAAKYLNHPKHQDLLFAIQEKVK